MDIVNKIERLLGDQVAMTAGSGATTTANVAINTAKGHIDVIGGECPKGQKYDPKKKVCVPIVKEMSVVGGSYLGGTTVNIIGSGQTRVWGEKHHWMIDLDRKEPVVKEIPDKAKQNIEMRKGLRFDKLLGAYVPHGDTKIEPRYIDLEEGTKLERGDTVKHKRHGKGKIVSVQGNMINVKFGDKGGTTQVQVSIHDLIKEK